MSIDELFGEEDERPPGRHISGVAAGIVTKNDDETGLARVKVRYPWRSSEESSDWVRIAVPMAGEKRGTFFLPEVGDEVLVAFEHGDIRFPYIIGALWNSDDVPPVERAKQTDVRKIRSESGHEVVLDDTEDKERVEIRTAGGHEVVLDDTEDKERVTVTDSAGQSVVLDAGDNSVTIKGASKLSLSARTVELAGETSVSISSNGQLSLDGAIIELN